MSESAPPPGFFVRPALRAELDLLIDWAAAEGWNPGLADADSFWAADPGGYFVGVLDGEPVSGISVVRYPCGFAFLGFYLVRPEFRGRGCGWATWQAGLAHVQDYNVGLDGVVARQANYRKSGFVLAHNNVRYQGAAPGKLRPDPRPMPIGPAILAEVLDYDRLRFPDTREGFLWRWLARPRLGWAFMEQGRCGGYGVIRACRQGYKIGPLFADRPEIAEILLAALVSEIGTAEFFLDVPKPNQDAVWLAERWGMEPVFETARMYNRRDPRLPIEQIYGLTSFELG